MASFDSYNKLKRIYGIRNRFWVRNIDELTPLVKDAHRRALVQNHKALVIALKATERALRSQNKSKPDHIFFRRFARSFQYLRRVGPFLLRSGQRIELLEKGDRVSLTIRNQDGSLDATFRRRLLTALEPIENDINLTDTIDLIDQPQGDWVTQILEKHLPFEYQPATNDTDMIEEILQSPAGQLLGNYLPGLPLLMKLYKERSRIKDGEWLTVAGEMLGDGIKSTWQELTSFIMSQFQATAQVAHPLSFLLGITIDRSILLKKQSDAVERAQKRIEELHPLYLQYHKNS